MAVYTVSQVSSHIKESLESDPLLMDLWVVGEVSGLRNRLMSQYSKTYITILVKKALEFGGLSDDRRHRLGLPLF